MEAVEGKMEVKWEGKEVRGEEMVGRDRKKGKERKGKKRGKVDKREVK